MGEEAKAGSRPIPAGPHKVGTLLSLFSHLAFDLAGFLVYARHCPARPLKISNAGLGQWISKT